MPTLAILSLAVSFTMAASHAAPADTGVWRGTLVGRHDTTQVRLILERNDERWAGRLRLCRDARDADFPLDSVRVDPAAARGDSVPVSFVVRRMRGHPRFSGTVSWDDRIVGTLRTARGALALSVERAGGGGAMLSCP